jgi:hypothetical protein
VSHRFSPIGAGSRTTSAGVAGHWVRLSQLAG